MISSKEANSIETITLRNIELEVLGERLRRARVDKKLSQRDLSSGLFTSAYLSSLELGKTRPTLRSLRSLAERLDKSTEYFLRQTSAMADDLDEEQVRILEVRLALLTAQTALERRADVRTDKILNQVALHLARLNNPERARYHYLRGRFHNNCNEVQAALEELEHARGYLVEGQDPELEILVGYETGNNYYLQSRLMSALNYYTAGLEQINSSEQSFILNLKWKLLLAIANCYLLLNDWEQAIEFFRQALDQAGSVMDLNSQAELYYGLATSYGEKGDFQRSCLSLGRSLQIYDSIEDRLQLVRTRNALAQMQAQTGHFDKAEEQVQEALKIVQSNTSFSQDRCQEMHALVTMAIIRQKQELLDQAQNFINEALSLRTMCEEGPHLGRLYQVAAEIQADAGDKKQSDEYFSQALKILEVSGLATSLADIYHSYGQRLRNWGQVDRAFEFMEKAYRQRERGRADNEKTRNEF